jgi:hypothetical protein
VGNENIPHAGRKAREHVELEHDLAVGETSGGAPIAWRQRRLLPKMMGRKIVAFLHHPRARSDPDVRFIPVNRPIAAMDFQHCHAH